MEVERVTAVGATDLDAERLVTALEAVIPRAGFALQWVPGAKTWKETGCGLHIFWRFFPSRGTWVNLPPEPHGRKLAIALVQQLDRPLVFHEARWLIDDEHGELQVESWDMQLDGRLQPRPTGLEGKDLAAISSGKGHDRLGQLLQHLMGIVGCGTPTHGSQLPLFEVDPGAKPGDGQTQGSVDQKRLADVLTVLRDPGVRQAKLIREEADRYHVTIHKTPRQDIAMPGASAAQRIMLMTPRFDTYVNGATVEALMKVVQEEQLPELQGPSISELRPRLPNPPDQTQLLSQRLRIGGQAHRAVRASTCHCSATCPERWVLP